ncbi:hypothetical protein C8R43DRAFT_957056 [Mycena crocata]|nr:hypothetical protein C8R43DRAFT_957056 [Mycena crocata]
MSICISKYGDSATIELLIQSSLVRLAMSLPTIPMPTTRTGEVENSAGCSGGSAREAEKEMVLPCRGRGADVNADADLRELTLVKGEAMLRSSATRRELLLCRAHCVCTAAVGLLRGAFAAPELARAVGIEPSQLRRWDVGKWCLERAVHRGGQADLECRIPAG